MKAFIPYDVTDDMIVSSSIPEPAIDEPIWNNATTYAEFAQVSVISANSHQIFESLVAGNINNDPLTTNRDVLKEGAKWILKGKTNRHRMFEYNKGAPSVASSPLNLVIRPGKRIGAIALGGLKATILDLTVTNGIDGPVAYTLDGTLQDRKVSSPYEWCFARFSYISIISTFNIPPISDPVIYLTLTDPTGIVELGRFAFGEAVYIGNIQWSPIVDSDNYSTIEWDKFGEATFSPLPRKPAREYKVIFKNNRLEIIQKLEADANAQITFWSGMDDMESEFSQTLMMFGAYGNYQIDIGNLSESVLNISLKGV